MKSLIKFSILLVIAAVCSAEYEGPYLLWGLKGLDDIKVPTLQAIDDRTLREAYSNASSILVFVKNATTKLNYANFPKLSDVIQKNNWIYLPQEVLSSDPLDFNVNVEVFILTGSEEQQDTEIAALFRDAQVTYGDDKVLGILATKQVTEEHRMLKRQAEPFESSSTVSPTDEPTAKEVLFDTRKAMLYSKNKLELRINSELIELDGNGMVTDDVDKTGAYKIVVKYRRPADTLYVKFAFRREGSYWNMFQVEVDIPGSTALNSTILGIVGDSPSAPNNYSYACYDTHTFVYRNRSESSFVSLTINMIQVQPYIEPTGNSTETKFSRPYDCVGIVTPPILAGIFVTTIIGFVLAVALSAIMDIKTPNKFENRSTSKQLSFTVQE